MGFREHRQTIAAGWRVLVFALSMLLSQLPVAKVYAEDSIFDSWFGDSTENSDASSLARVQVAEPFVEWRTGPAEGYPVVHVSERGEWMTILLRKTQWLKVENAKGKQGWVHIDDILKTKDETGEIVSISEPRFDDFSSRRWEFGMAAGEFDETALNSAYAGYWMTENLSIELWGQQILGQASEIRMLKLNLVHQMFPSWRWSPYINLGAGMLFIEPKATLANAEDRTEESAHVGAGMRVYIDDRYFVRAGVNSYTVFTDRETNEEAIEWKVGLSIFF